ncbi:MAG: hypothetical protein PVF28_03645 [Thioalkalispiraceae bacterium]|jgi:hypothetical protein
MNPLAAVLLAMMCCGSFAVEAATEINAMSDSIQTVKQRHNDELMAIEGVIAVGIGQAPDGSSAIIITMEEGQQQAASQLPKTLEGYPVIIQYSGKIRAQ